MPIESHPLQPFLPQGGKVLFLGSFPPPQQRWSMPFFYPNFINDFWRIMGVIFHDEKDYFIIKGVKAFDKDKIIAFCKEYGIALYDTASKVRRLKDNASDNHLEIVQPTDISALLDQMPQCHTIVTTGGKASEEICQQYGIKDIPSIGQCTHVSIGTHEVDWWRMPSTSRAYPLRLEKKAEYYRHMLCNIQLSAPVKG